MQRSKRNGPAQYYTATIIHNVSTSCAIERVLGSFYYFFFRNLFKKEKKRKRIVACVIKK